MGSETSLQIRCSLPSSLTYVPEYLRTTTAMKVLKSGGLIRTQKTATIAEAAGLRCYEGTSLETSVGTKASLHLFSAVPNLAERYELIGPLLLAD